MKSKVKKAARILTIGVTLNSLGLIILRTGLGYLVRPLDDPIIIKSEEDYIKKYDSTDFSLNARDYLNLSSGVVLKYATDKQVCRQKARATFDFYRKLTKANGREDLESKVRVALSCNVHTWLEIKEKGTWTPYESTQRTPELSFDRVKEYSKKTKDEKSKLNAGNKANLISIGGTNIFYPPTTKSFFEGLSGYLYNCLTQKPI